VSFSVFITRRLCHVPLLAFVLVCAIRMAEMMADVQETDKTSPCARINKSTADTPATPSSTTHSPAFHRCCCCPPLVFTIILNSSQVSPSILLFTFTTLPLPLLLLCRLNQTSTLPLFTSSSGPLTFLHHDHHQFHHASLAFLCNSSR
jgi:hypothetical protein